VSGLAKALLQEVRGDRSRTPVGTALEVQFNPETLRLTLSNQVEGGNRQGRQVRQYIGASSTELAFDLVFDTADEIGEDGAPRSVREKTGMVERFLRPRGPQGQKQAVPMVRFHWGDVVVEGIIESLSVDFGLFSPGGVPLRAKMSVKIKEQDARYQYHEADRGSNRQVAPSAESGGAAAAPGGPGGGGAGGQGSRTEEALAGESLAEFAARQGLDPSAWRALADGVPDPMSLLPGQEIRFPSGQLAPRLGLATPALALPLECASGPAAEREPRVPSDGRALTAGGGVAAGLAGAAAAGAERAAERERRAFSLQARQAEGGSVAPAGRAAPALDARALAFGHGVPLRPRVGGAAAERGRAILGGAPLRPDSRAGDAVRPADPTTPPWTRLPPGDVGRAAADRSQAVRRPRRPCGCGCGGPRPGGGSCRCG
jgi:hypothetical protein